MDRIILFHQDGCPQCKMVEGLLNKNKIEYTSCKDINKMKELGLNHTPALLVNEHKMLQGKEMIDYIKSLQK